MTTVRKQTAALAEINTALHQMDQMTQQNAAMVEETNAACRELSDEVQDLNNAAGRFQISGAAGSSARKAA